MMNRANNNRTTSV